jgi:hypothetical protein
MKSRKGILKIRNTRRLWLDAVLVPFLTVIVGFFTIGGQNLQAANTLVAEGLWQVHHPAGDVNLGNDHHTGHFPFAPNPTPLEPEFPDEGESNDNIDNELDKLFSSLHLTTRINIDSGRCLLSQLRLSIQSRSGISLFVLHHSWRTFLS